MTAYLMMNRDSSRVLPQLAGSNSYRQDAKFGNPAVNQLIEMESILTELGEAGEIDSQPDTRSPAENPESYPTK